MKPVLKILLLLLAIFPLWVTILAFGEESKLEVLKSKMNSELLKVTDRHLQVLEILSRDKALLAFDANAKFSIELSSVAPRGTSNLVLKSVDASGRLLQMVRVPVKLFVEDQVGVATRDLSRGEILSAEDFKVEWRDAGQLQTSVPSAEEIKGQMTRTYIRAGDVIYSSAIQHQAMVSRGDRVKVRVVGPGILLTVMGQALETGGKGQSIKVVNLESQKEFVGVITNSKEIEVRL